MTNDTTTLNGALRELGETMAANLTTQGVPSTYDEGLTTLAGKILDIQGGSGVRTLTLVSDVDILSFADGDEAILSATLLEDGVAVPNATVEFFNGSTSMGTAQTDSTGVATKTYTSTGVGDVSFSAEADNGMLVSKTYTIEDCTFYNPLTSNANGFTVPSAVSSSSTYGFSSNGWKYGNASSSQQMPLSPSITNHCSIEFVVQDYSTGTNPTPVLRAYNGSSIVFSLFGQWGGNGWWLGSNNTKISSNAPVKGATYRLDVTSTSLKLYENNTLVGTVNQSITVSSMELRLETGSNRFNELKDFKLKPL